MRFVHRISKGSRFNQIYIPKEMREFEVGDLVEVRLLKKNMGLFYSKNLGRISEFKEKLIKDVFSLLSEFSEILQIFVVGSFLTEKIDYNDIDLLIITKKKNENLEEKVYNALINKFNLKFHLLIVRKERFEFLKESCPLTRSMLYYCVSKEKFEITKKREVDKNHIRFLLMMPEDILEIKVEGRAFYNNLRRLLTIEKFLKEEDEDPKKINDELKSLIGDSLFFYLKNNLEIDEKMIGQLRKIIKNKLDSINKILN